MLGAIKGALAFCARGVAGQVNPAALLKYAKTPKVRIDPLGVAEAETLVAALHADWDPGIAHFHELRIFSGLRPCEALALRVSDYDRAAKCLSVTKTRVRGRERFKARRAAIDAWCSVLLAIDVLERQLAWRASLAGRGLIEYELLFCTQSGRPFRNAEEVGPRWMRTLARLPIRYRRPYVARHTSVSWRLTVGEPPLWVAQQHGHSVIAMFTVYAGWIDGAEPSQVTAIRPALDRPAPRGSIWHWICHFNAEGAPQDIEKERDYWRSGRPYLAEEN